MTAGDLLLVLGVFLGGALPGLEAVVVVPAGVLGGLHPVVAVVAGATGNLLTVAVAAWFGQRIRRWWLRRRADRQPDGPAAGDGAPQPTRRERRWRRVERVVQRWGMPALAVLGPLGLGTQVSALVAVSLGTGPRAAFGWISAGTVLWAVVAAVAAATGLSVAGFGRG